jgi:glycosyltransferase (activator-dependent family)
MRILFVTAPFRSHLYVQVPLAWALAAAGHDVRVASAPDIAGDVAEAGLAGVPVGDVLALRERMAAAEPAAKTPDVPQPRRKAVQSEYGIEDPLAEFESNVLGWQSLFHSDSTFEDLIAFTRHWRPDLIISDTFMFAGGVAARICGASHARMLFGADGLAQLRGAVTAAGGGRWPAGKPDPLRDWLDPILRRHGESFDEQIALGEWTVIPMPSCVWRPAGVHYLPVRHLPFNGPARTPDWLLEPPGRPRVCVTLGLAHREDDHGVAATAEDLFAAVAELDVEVVATLNAKQLGHATIPRNVRVVDFAPLNLLLPTCSAVVHSGGAGTFAGAVANGVPQLIVPNVYWSEKWWGSVAMANAVEDRGAGVYVADADQLTAPLLHEQLARVLDDPSFQAGADRLRWETLSLPTPHDLVPVLERLTLAHRTRD